jgi:hypothetical protein
LQFISKQFLQTAYQPGICNLIGAKIEAYLKLTLEEMDYLMPNATETDSYEAENADLPDIEDFRFSKLLEVIPPLFIGTADKARLNQFPSYSLLFGQMTSPYNPIFPSCDFDRINNVQLIPSTPRECIFRMYQLFADREMDSTPIDPTTNVILIFDFMPNMEIVYDFTKKKNYLLC